MLYFLLTIIAIGVLLASEEGKQILNAFTNLVILAGIVLLIWFGAILFLDSNISENIRKNWEGITDIVFVIFLIVYAGYIFNEAYKKHRRGDFRKEIVKKRIKDYWSGIWNESLISRLAIIFLGLSFVYFIFMAVYLSKA